MLPYRRVYREITQYDAKLRDSLAPRKKCIARIPTTTGGGSEEATTIRREEESEEGKGQGQGQGAEPTTGEFTSENKREKSTEK